MDDALKFYFDSVKTKARNEAYAEANKHYLEREQKRDYEIQQLNADLLSERAKNATLINEKAKLQSAVDQLKRDGYGRGNKK